MNYKHAYHAGNFSDVFKHLILLNLLSYLGQKDSPFCVLDTHAGAGIYDLNSSESQKTFEFQDGILKLFRSKMDGKLIETYQTLIKKANNAEETIRWYPGSPKLTRYMLRENDRLIACELHDGEMIKLKRQFRGDKQVAIHHTDGFKSLNAFLPPKEKRGLILIDPPYDRKDRETEDYDQIIEALKIGYKKFPQGIYAIWYPIKDRKTVKKFHDKIKALGIPGILITELLLYKDDNPDRFNGTGMVIINPPWKTDKTIKELLPQLLNILKKSSDGTIKVSWLNK